MTNTHEELRYRVLECLHDLGLLAHARPGRRPEDLPDGVAIWVLGDANTEVLVVPQTLEPETVAKVRAGLPRLWIAEHFTDRAAGRLLDDGRQFADAAGNARINQPGLHVQVLGRQPTRAAAATREPLVGREWRQPALRVLFHLLCDTQLAQRPIREIAALGQAAPGTVVRLFDDLEEAQHLVRLNRRERRFRPNRDLYDRWIEEYGRKLRPALFIGRYTAVDPNWHREFDPVANGALWGAEAAAERLGAELRPGIRTLYTAAATTKLLQAAGLRADAAGEVELRRAFWTTDLPTARPDTTPPLLVVADLLATRDGRCHAAAADIRKRFVDEQS